MYLVGYPAGKSPENEEGRERFRSHKTDMEVRFSLSLFFFLNTRNKKQEPLKPTLGSRDNIT